MLWAIVAGGRAALAQCTYDVQYISGFACGGDGPPAALNPVAINDLGHIAGEYICGAGFKQGYI